MNLGKMGNAVGVSGGRAAKWDLLTGKFAKQHLRLQSWLSLQTQDHKEVTWSKGHVCKFAVLRGGRLDHLKEPAFALRRGQDHLAARHAVAAQRDGAGEAVTWDRVSSGDCSRTSKVGRSHFQAKDTEIAEVAVVEAIDEPETSNAAQHQGEDHFGTGPPMPKRPLHVRH